jgi:hypothetical protein
VTDDATGVTKASGFTGLGCPHKNLSYNDLASNAIDHEGTMKACEAAEEKKRKRTMPGPTGGNSSPPKYRMVYTPPTGQPR